MDQILTAAEAASQLYVLSWRRGNIVRAQKRLRERSTTKALVNFYLDEIEREINFMLFKDLS